MAYNEPIAQRMKGYEYVTRSFLPRRTYTIIRVDGKAFHTFCRFAYKPFDETIIRCMGMVAIELVECLQGSCFAYYQSDECSILLTDFATIKTQAAFGGNVQKLVSISASIATAAFNHTLLDEERERLKVQELLALFDSRVFTIPDRTEVENYFIWRQQDAIRNSISITAQSLYSHKELQKKNKEKILDMISAKGVDWNNYPTVFKHGGIIVPGYEDTSNIPVFTQDRQFLSDLIPHYG